MRISEVAFADANILKDAYKTLSMDNITWEFLESKIKESAVEKIKHFLKPENRIYRGMKDTGTLIIGDGDKLRRQSANTDNYYTRLFNILPSWKDMPRRDRSFICSSGNGAPYGTIFLAIPLEDQPVGICPSYDLWLSFPKLKDYKLASDTLDSFNNVLNQINTYLHKIGITPREIPDATNKEFGEYIKTLNEYFANYYDPTNIETPRIVDNFYNTTNDHGGVIRTLNQAFDPRENGFELKNANSITGYSKPHEMWMTGKVLFIRADMAKELADAITPA